MNPEPSPGQAAVRSSLRGALLLGIFALIGAGLVAVTWQLTHERIANNQQMYLLRNLHEILAVTEYDNTLHEDTRLVHAPALGGVDGMVTVYRARQGGMPIAVIFEATAPDGYAGAIKLLVGVYTNGEIAGVRVVAHSETPGLGDDIELSRSDWVLAFQGKSLQSPPAGQWAVKRDGGAFDQFTGATITPRAVVKAVRNALLYFRDHRDQLFAQGSSDRD